MAELAAGGFTPAETAADGRVSGETPATITRLEESDGDRYWLTFMNFYVITRYNRSPLYAMAVHELSEAILAGFEP
jgi:membrane-bound lytic murein transglycosylase B